MFIRGFDNPDAGILKRQTVLSRWKDTRKFPFSVKHEYGLSTSSLRRQHVKIVVRLRGTMGSFCRVETAIASKTLSGSLPTGRESPIC